MSVHSFIYAVVCVSSVSASVASLVINRRTATRLRSFEREVKVLAADGDDPWRNRCPDCPHYWLYATHDCGVEGCPCRTCEPQS